MKIAIVEGPEETLLEQASRDSIERLVIEEASRALSQEYFILHFSCPQPLFIVQWLRNGGPDPSWSALADRAESTEVVVIVDEGIFQYFLIYRLSFSSFFVLLTCIFLA